MRKSRKVGALGGFIGVAVLFSPAVNAINTWGDDGISVGGGTTRRYDGPVTGILGSPAVPRYFGEGTQAPLFIRAKTDPTQGDTEISCPTAGNPVVMATGNKVEKEVDLALPGEMGLLLERTWNQKLGEIGIFGFNWLSNFDRRLIFTTANPSNSAPCSPNPVSGQCQPVYMVTGIWALRPDGRKIKFFENGKNLFKESKPGPVAQVVGHANGWTLYTEDHQIEEYSVGGLIKQVTNEHGVGWSFAYGGSNGAKLQSVTHTSGRKITFIWSGDQVATVLDPANTAYQYGYVTIDQHANNPNGKRVLASVVLPGSPATTIAYHYANARAADSPPISGLAGKSYSGFRFSTFTYNADLRAISTEHAGVVERYSFDYVLDANRRVLKTVETNPLNKRTEYTFTPDGKLLSVAGQPSAHCGSSYKERTYDANGYDDIVSDFDNNLTDFDYDAHGHLIKQVEAKGTADQRTTTYVWDEANNRLLQKTLEGVKQTTYAYSSGRLVSVTEKNLSSTGWLNAIRTTTYTYTQHPNGMLASVVENSPLPGMVDAIITTYSVAGDLLSVRNGLGHTINYSQYNELGLPRHIVDENDAVTDISYDARGRTTNVRTYPNGSPADTQYQYNEAGLLAAVITPDQTKTGYVYDDARRPTDIYQPEPGGTYAVKHLELNAMSLPTRISIRRSANDPSVPSPRTAPTLTVPATSNGSHEVSWSEVPSATTYQLEESASGTAWALIQDSSARSRLVSGKAPGSYGYRVRACNPSGCSAYSNQVTTLVAAGPQVPSAPANLKVTYFVDSSKTPPDTTFKGIWSGVNGATRYELMEGTKSVYSGVGLVYEYTRMGGGPTANAFKVRACNDGGCSDWSAGVTPVLR